MGPKVRGALHLFRIFPYANEKTARIRRRETSEEHAWPISFQCHAARTYVELPRTKADAYFSSFQLRPADLTATSDNSL